MTAVAIREVDSGTNQKHWPSLCAWRLGPTICDVTQDTVTTDIDTETVVTVKMTVMPQHTIVS